jgi:hypothetical protein
MYATIRRYEAIDQSRTSTSELVKKVDETLVPRLSKLPGFSGDHLIEAGDGVTSSVGFFDTSAQADESTRVASNWVREEKLETALPNAPKVTAGEIVVHKPRELVGAQQLHAARCRREGPHPRAFLPSRADSQKGRHASVRRDRQV